MTYAMATPKEHIEEIRRKMFFIGSEVINPLTKMVHRAVELLSAELYTKDVHFLMELIQVCTSSINLYLFSFSFNCMYMFIIYKCMHG